MSLFDCNVPKLKSIPFVLLILINLLGAFKIPFIEYQQQHLGVNVFFQTIGDTFGILFYILEKSRMKRTINTKSNSISQNNFNIIKLLCLILPGLLNSIYQIIRVVILIQIGSGTTTFSALEQTILSWLRSLLRVYSIVYFYRIILSKKIFKHHIISLILITIGIVVLFPSYFFGTVSNKYDITNIFFIESAFYFVFSILQPFFKIIQKYLIEKYFYSGFLVMFITGITSIICFIPAFIAFSSSEKYSAPCMFQENVMWSICSLIYHVIYEALYFKILSDLTPIHLVLIEIVIMLIRCISTNSRIIIWFFSSGLVIIGFSLYLEIIVFKSCGMDENIEDNIHQRSVSEVADDVKLVEDCMKQNPNLYSINADSNVDNNIGIINAI